MSAIADTYAQAMRSYFDRGQEQDFFNFLEELELLYESLKTKEIKHFFISPAISCKQKKQVLTSCFNSVKCNELLSVFLFLILDKKRWLELDSILVSLRNIKNKMKGIVLGEVESVKDLDLDLKQKIIKKLSEFFNKEVCLKQVISSKNLIGGIKIRSRGLVFDDTLLFHLTQMENQIRRGFYEDTSKRN